MFRTPRLGLWVAVVSAGVIPATTATASKAQNSTSFPLRLVGWTRTVTNADVTRQANPTLVGDTCIMVRTSGTFKPPRPPRRRSVRHGCRYG